MIRFIWLNHFSPKRNKRKLHITLFQGKVISLDFINESHNLEAYIIILSCWAVRSSKETSCTVASSFNIGISLLNDVLHEVITCNSWVVTKTWLVNAWEVTYKTFLECILIFLCLSQICFSLLFRHRIVEWA